MKPGEKAVQAIFVSRRHFQPCCAHDTGIHSRRRRTGIFLSHAFGAAFDNPDLIVACVVGDGEAETGPLATAWQSNKFLDPITDGAVLPILISMDTRSATPPSWPASNTTNWNNFSAAAAGRPLCGRRRSGEDA